MPTFMTSSATGVSSDALFFDTQPAATFAQGPSFIGRYSRQWTSGPFAGLYVYYESAAFDFTYDAFGTLVGGHVTTMYLFAADFATQLASLTGLNNSAANLTKAGLLSTPQIRIYGGAGNDFLSASDVGTGIYGSGAGDNGNDTLLGGAGNDGLYSSGGVDVIDGGGGTNFLDFQRTTSNVSFLFSLAVPTAQQTLVDGSTIRNISQIHFRAGEGNDSLQGGASLDTLAGGGGNDTLDGGLGADYLDGQDGDDTLLSLAGNNFERSISGDVGTDTLVLDRTGAASPIAVNLFAPATHSGSIQDVGGAYDILGVERFNLTGGSGNDTLAALEFSDTLDGGLGADLFSAGAGADRLISGVGNTLEGNNTFLSVDGGADIDTLVLQRSGPVGVNVVIATGLGTVLVTDVGGFWAANNTERLEFSGGTGNDTVTGGNYADDLNGGVGNDSLTGGDGNDFLTGGAGNDNLNGGADFDYANYLDSSTTAGITVSLAVAGAQNTGGAGIDTLTSIEGIYGSNLGDTLTGDGAAVNALYGWGGADLLTGAGGFDYVEAGEGDDTLDGGAGDDFLLGGNGTDWVSYYGSTAAVYVDMSGASAFANGTATGFDVLSGIERVYGSIYGDFLFGSAGSNTLVGDSGVDIIYGFGLGDSLDGGADTDYLVGGVGADIITTGSGQDYIYFQGQTEGKDTITDWRVSGFDILVIDEPIFGGGLTAGQYLSGAGNANRFVAGTAATAASGQFLWNSATSTLSWDADGTGAGAAVQLVTLTGITSLTAGDILVL